MYAGEFLEHGLLEIHQPSAAFLVPVQELVDDFPPLLLFGRQVAFLDVIRKVVEVFLEMVVLVAILSLWFWNRHKGTALCRAGPLEDMFARHLEGRTPQCSTQPKPESATRSPCVCCVNKQCGHM